jgi:hypothetical protein
MHPKASVAVSGHTSQKNLVPPAWPLWLPQIPGQSVTNVESIAITYFLLISTLASSPCLITLGRRHAQEAW